jgi:hypothetical protein
LEAVRAMARAGHEEPAPYNQRDHPAGWSDEFDNDYEHDNDDDKNPNADCYGRCMRHGWAKVVQIFFSFISALYMSYYTNEIITVADICEGLC